MIYLIQKILFYADSSIIINITIGFLKFFKGYLKRIEIVWYSYYQFFEKMKKRYENFFFYYRFSIVIDKNKKKSFFALIWSISYNIGVSGFKHVLHIFIQI